MNRLELAGAVARTERRRRIPVAGAAEVGEVGDAADLAEPADRADALQTCSTIQRPMTTSAGISVMNRKTRTRTWLCGNQTTYAPMIPAIAPEAPSVGISESGLAAIWRSVPDQAARQVDDQVADGAQDLLDVVAEDPEVEHVPGQVQRAAVQEHGREQRQPDRERDVVCSMIWRRSHAARPADQQRISRRRRRKVDVVA